MRLIVRTLGLIEELGSTVAEFNRQELRSVLHESLVEWDKTKAKTKAKEKEPEVTIDLTWKEPKPPFEINVGQSLKIKYQLSVEDGKVANDVKVLFLLPPGFEIEGLASWAQGADRGDMANYVTTETNHGKLQRGLATLNTINIKTTNEPGTYKCFYRILSDEYGTREEFSITVKQ